MMKFLAFFSAAIVMSVTNIACAKCNLPIPDEWTNVPNRNLDGYLVGKKGDEIIIKKYEDGKLIKVNISEINSAYSVFGGDESLSKLILGIPVRIWYKNCKNPTNSTPVAAYLEVYSNDAKDKPTESYFKRSGR